MVKFFKKYHKWLSIILTVFIIAYALSGIVLNHRSFFSGTDVNRNYLPHDYRYSNWNLAAVKGTEKINNDSILIYGNIGIFLTDSSMSYFNSFNNGFQEGVDNHKIEKLIYKNNHLLSATLFGLFSFNFETNKWTKIFEPRGESRIVDIAAHGNKFLIMSRSHIYETYDLINFKRISLKPYVGYDNKIGLFKTLWVIHSGEIYGLPGILLVDFIALIFIFLTLTGLVYFIVQFITKTKKHKNDRLHNLKIFN
ncbi:MAG: hypothetical protein C0598_01290 [Marinilabiliales bacterium]|nr:MAG: hypothetical protein C0598_01290 [Marinilabiliales bacterium]